jgi:chorismate-pyruvate lyase
MSVTIPIRKSSLNQDQRDEDVSDDIPLGIYLKTIRKEKRKKHAKNAIEVANKQLVKEKRYGMVFPLKPPKVQFGSDTIKCI